jgi:phytoene synthase
MDTTGSVLRNIFLKGSTTYFNASLFFPKAVRRDVFRLYAFVRTADDFVDAVPQDGEKFYRFRERYERAYESGMPSGDIVIDEFVSLSREKRFDPEWTRDFLDAMESDLSKKEYETIDELIPYMHGSAEVIGLLMARVLGLPEESNFSAMRLGRAMQYINFIRDIAEDNALERRYLPAAESGLPDLREETARGNPDLFVKFIRTEIDRYRTWQAEAEKGFAYIPGRARIAVMTASAIYDWTSRVIYDDPFTVYRKKVKPSKLRVCAVLAVKCVSARRG